MAMFSVDADAAQRMIDYSGLQVCRYLPGRAVVVLMLMHYIDGDLGEYHEFSTSVMVNPPGSTRAGYAPCSAGAFIHHMLVDQAFTLEAGRTIWGYPKVMADFTVREGGSVRLRREHRRPARGRHGIPSRPAGSVGIHLAPAGVCARTPIATAHAARPFGMSTDRCRVTGSAGRSCGSAITHTPKNLRRSACRSARSVELPLQNVEMSFGDARRSR